MVNVMVIDRFVYLINKFFKKSRFSAVKNSKISPLAKVHSGCLIVNSSMDRYSYCGYDCNILNSKIGSFCSIGGKVSMGGYSHPVHFVSTSPAFLSHRDSVTKKFANFDYLPVNLTTIGNDVWIGEGAFIKAGVKIGDGAIVGMGSIVTKDVEPYAIVAGNPARLIRKRFSDDIISGLLELKWWDFPEEELRSCGDYFSDPKALLKHKGII